jgi:phage gp36-like protein
MAYASQADLLQVGFPQAAVGVLSVAQIAAALQSASDYADGFFRARWGAASVPLLTWDSSVTDAVVKIAAFRLLKVRGFNPQSPQDAQFKADHDDAIDWLNKVQRQQAHPLVTLAAHAAPPVAPLLITGSVVNLSSGAMSKNRGW